MQDIDSIESLEKALCERLAAFKAKLEELKASGKHSMKYADFRDFGAWSLVPRYTPKFNAESAGTFNGNGFAKTPSDKVIAKFAKKQESLVKKYGMSIK